jgi:hypothetical protein
MPQNNKPQMTSLAGICRRLAEARKRVAELEAQRDALIKALRGKGVSGSMLAARTGLSAGRVTQISQSKDGHKPS